MLPKIYQVLVSMLMILWIILPAGQCGPVPKVNEVREYKYERMYVLFAWRQDNTFK